MTCNNLKNIILLFHPVYLNLYCIVHNQTNPSMPMSQLALKENGNSNETNTEETTGEYTKKFKKKESK